MPDPHSVVRVLPHLDQQGAGNRVVDAMQEVHSRHLHCPGREEPEGGDAEREEGCRQRGVGTLLHDVVVDLVLDDWRQRARDELVAVVGDGEEGGEVERHGEEAPRDEEVVWPAEDGRVVVQQLERAHPRVREHGSPEGCFFFLVLFPNSGVFGLLIRCRWSNKTQKVWQWPE